MQISTGQACLTEQAMLPWQQLALSSALRPLRDGGAHVGVHIPQTHDACRAALSHALDGEQEACCACSALRVAIAGLQYHYLSVLCKLSACWVEGGTYSTR